MPKNNSNQEPENQTRLNKPSIGEGLSKLADAATALCKSSEIYADVPDDQKLEAADHAKSGEIWKCAIICVTLMVCFGVPSIIKATKVPCTSAC
ncbi:MAG: hypothetical protein E7576_06900 [Ruminococcaceae bacterium]|nr:hypothetical protein [Oscillospiraceae bacterium]